MLKTLFSVYYLLMIGEKMYIDDNEPIQKFLINFINFNYDLNKVKSCITNNDLNMIKHHWIREISVNKLGNAMISRFKMGIAGSRYLNILKNKIMIRKLLAI